MVRIAPWGRSTVKNYYGRLCAETYEVLHAAAPEDELAFYLSYARAGDKILELMCGSGRFLVPFMERGFDITGIDLSEEMLSALYRKTPQAHAFKGDILEFSSDVLYDYIFISSGSFSLFTDAETADRVLVKLRSLLAPHGKMVIAAESMAGACNGDGSYRLVSAMPFDDGGELRFSSMDRYDAKTQTQYSPGRYELYRDGELVESEWMDFQIRLYRFGELEQRLERAGFASVTTYRSFDKEPAKGDMDEMFLYECSVG